MDVFAGVTTKATCCRHWHGSPDFGRWLAMATRAGNFGVGAVEDVAGLPRVLEVPGLPGACAVADFALAAQGTLVDVIAVMAFGANRRCVLKSDGLVARLALCSGVRTTELEL